MKFRSDLHMHTTYSDGKNTPEEMIKSSLERGFDSIGFSEHAPAPYDMDCQINPDHLPGYFSEIARLKQKYKGQIEISLGMEIDALCVFDKEKLDYTITSVHYLKDDKTGKIYSVDYRERDFRDAVEAIGAGDVKALARIFYETAWDVLEAFKPDIAGHIDSIVKLNQNNRFFDEESAWYHKLLEQTAEKAASAGCIVEVNTGGICRGYRQTPYPSAYMLSALLSLGVPITLCSDAHSADNIGFWFDEAMKSLKDLGYKSLKKRQSGTFIDVEI